MTRTKKEIIETINRLRNRDDTQELEKEPKYRLCAILQELRNDTTDSESDQDDLVSKIGVRVK
jgi:Asp-tRNA(Asn)/Glu-tRNA(Gln) amidotransferase C subunit